MKAMEIPDILVTFLKRSTRVACLTGAGVSQESGLRTFRDTQDGIWNQYKPEDLASLDAFKRNPKLIWDWYAIRREKVQSVTPNAGHFALAQMEKLIPEFTLITQNVDGLHLKAGSVHVIELHGNLQRVKCSLCGRLAADWSGSGDGVPVCSACGGKLRPDVVWFGEALPRAELELAVSIARECEMFFSIGTSGVVQPAASLAYAARNHGAILVEINPAKTPLTDKVDFALSGKSSEVLSALVKATWPK